MGQGIGNLRHRITIEERLRVADGYGGLTTTGWLTVFSIWAAVEPTSGRERFFAGKLEHVITHKVRIRYRAGVRADMRVNFGGRFLQIRGVTNEDERGRWLILNCEEGASG